MAPMKTTLRRRGRALTQLKFAVALVVVACAAACGEASKSASRSGPSSLTIEEVWTRALDALAQPGRVYHSVHTTSFAGRNDKSEVWIDLEHDASRSQHGNDVSAYGHGHLALIEPGGRFRDAIYDSGLEKPASAAAGHIGWLFSKDASRQDVSDGDLNGESVTIVEVARPEQGDYHGTETAKIYLDTAFLPLQLEYESSTGPPGSLRGYTETFTSDFLPRDSLPADFFSFDVVRAKARTTLDDLRAAAADGFGPYWFGDPFEDVHVSDRSSYGADTGGGSVHDKTLRLSYAPNGGDPRVLVPCFESAQYTAQDAKGMLEQASGAARTGDVVIDSFDVPAGSATIYESPGAALPPSSITFGPPADWTPAAPGDQPPTPDVPALPSVPEDRGQYTYARVRLDSGGLIEIFPNCGPTGSNIYRTRAGFERVVRAVKPFESQ